MYQKGTITFQVPKLQHFWRELSVPHLPPGNHRGFCGPGLVDNDAEYSPFWELNYH